MSEEPTSEGSSGSTKAKSGSEPAELRRNVESFASKGKNAERSSSTVAISAKGKTLSGLALAITGAGQKTPCATRCGGSVTGASSSSHCFRGRARSARNRFLAQFRCCNDKQDSSFGTALCANNFIGDASAPLALVSWPASGSTWNMPGSPYKSRTIDSGKGTWKELVDSVGRTSSASLPQTWLCNSALVAIDRGVLQPPASQASVSRTRYSADDIHM
mmetsp:Transcript_86137/g.240879  ORF Transcript_86137/g.240879 Transcript_86137/m.240879 type:complete len:218 (-) Transcript_86137:162-815(-)